MNRELRISNILKDLGVATSLKGYQYLKYAIKCAMDDFTIIDRITKELYPRVAFRFKTTGSRVERAMRHAIETGWLKGDLDTQEEIFRYTVSITKCNPTNSEFVATVADYLLMTQEE